MTAKNSSNKNKGSAEKREKPWGEVDRTLVDSLNARSVLFLEFYLERTRVEWKLRFVSS